MTEYEENHYREGYYGLACNGGAGAPQLQRLIVGLGELAKVVESNGRRLDPGTLKVETDDDGHLWLWIKAYEEVYEE